MTVYKEESKQTAHALEPGELARRLSEVFRAAGEELYLVGGAVRDALLQREDIDLDFATSARPEKTASILQSLSWGTPYRVGEKFGTIGLRCGDRMIEITTYRSREVYPPWSRKPSVEFGRTLLEDLSRRDFTINAMAQDPISGEIVDPLSGLRDLRDRCIRAVGDPRARFEEDPLRLLRAVRFASRLGFQLEAETWDALRELAPRLDAISRERIRDEYSRILEGPHPVEGLTLLRDGGLAAHSVPQLLALTRMADHGPRHPMSLWEHTMRVVSGVPPRLVLRWAALLHDIAKPATRTHEPSGRPRFFHHEEIGAQAAREVLTGLRYSNEIVDAVALLVETHMQPHTYTLQWSDGAVRRFMLRFGPLVEDAILLARADTAGHSKSGVSANAPKFDQLEARIAGIGQERIEDLRSPLSGDDLMERYNRPPGPWIRGIKDRLQDEVLEGRLAPDDRRRAWEIADRLVEEGA
jgi:poly(A) polymerase